MAWEKYNKKGWQGRKDYIKLSARIIYISSYTLRDVLNDIEYVDIWYDIKANAISLRPTKGGFKIIKFKNQAHINISLAKVMPIGWYIYDKEQMAGNDIIFVLGKKEDLSK
jgi:hypothetical protein